MEYQELINSLTKIVVSTAFVAIVYIVGYIANKFKKWLAAKLDIENIDLLNKYADILVHAAEQLFTRRNSGEEKKNYVLEQLAMLGFESTEDVSAAIESAVYKMNRETSTTK